MCRHLWELIGEAPNPTWGSLGGFLAGDTWTESGRKCNNELNKNQQGWSFQSRMVAFPILYTYGIVSYVLCLFFSPKIIVLRFIHIENINIFFFYVQFYSSLWIYHNLLLHSSPHFSSVAQLCPTLCDPMNPSTPGLSVHQQLLEPVQIHVHPVGDAIQPSHPLSSPSPPALSIRVFSNESGGQSIEVSASASVLPMNIQDWSPLGWTGWISLQSKGLSRVFSNTTVQKHQFFGTQLSL